MVEPVKIPKAYEASFVFHHTSCRLWALLTDEYKMSTLVYHTSIMSTFLHQDSEKAFAKLTFQIQEVTQNNYTQTINWEITIDNIPNPLKVFSTFIVIPDTLNNSSIVTLSLVLSNPLTHPNHAKKIINGCKNLCIEFLHGINTYLVTSSDYFYEYESEYIKCSKEKVWNYVIQLELMKIYKETKLIIDGDSAKEGTKISCLFNDSKGIQCEVCTSDNNPKKNKWIFALNCRNEVDTSHAIIFTLIELTNGVTFFSLYNQLVQSENDDEIKILKQKRKQLIAQMKHILEDEQLSIDHQRQNMPFDEQLNHHHDIK